MGNFAIITLLIIVLALQHLLNWVIRKIWEDDHNGNPVITFIALIIAGGITVICCTYMYQWILETNIKTLLQ